MEARNLKTRGRERLFKKVERTKKKGILSRVKQETAYHAIESLSNQHTIKLLCKISEINRPSYYKWRSRKESDSEKENKQLLYKIKNLSQIKTWVNWYRNNELYRFDQSIGKQYSHGHGPEYRTDNERKKHSD